MKWLDKTAVILFTVCLFLSSALIPITFISTSTTFYRTQLKACGIYPIENKSTVIRYIGGNRDMSAAFTSEQFDEIIAHITDFMANKKQNFALQMDGINLNGEIVGSVNIFGNEAITHMNDVKTVFATAKSALVACVISLIVCAFYMFSRKSYIKKIIYKLSLGVTTSIFTIFALFFGGSFIKHLINGSGSFSDTLWFDMHHIFFPLSPEKFQASSFNDTLTYILTLDFFMNTVIVVTVCIISLTAIWLFFSKLISKK
ncbi:MAG: DUF1461 domain-containing protein [Clostridia bacterium]|nr:DUF1461 domain-containing protein [Clostridia bacterium]